MRNKRLSGSEVRQRVPKDSVWDSANYPLALVGLVSREQVIRDLQQLRAATADQRTVHARSISCRYLVFLVLAAIAPPGLHKLLCDANLPELDLFQS